MSNPDSVEIKTFLAMMRECSSHPGGVGGENSPGRAGRSERHRGENSPRANVTKGQGQPHLPWQCEHVQVQASSSQL